MSALSLSLDNLPTSLDEATFTVLYQRYGSRVLYHAASRLHGDIDTAADVAQSTWLKLWRLRDQITIPPGRSAPNWIAYLLTSIENACIEIHRRNQIIRMVPYDPVDHERLLGHEPDPADVILAHERGQARDDILAQLPERTRDMLIRAYALDQTHIQIGDAHGYHPKSVKSILYRGRAYLQEQARQRGLNPVPLHPKSAMRAPNGRQLTMRQVALLRAWAAGKDRQAACTCGHYALNQGTEVLRSACRQLGTEWQAADSRQIVAAFLASQEAL